MKSAYRSPGGGYYRERYYGLLPEQERPVKRVQPFPVVEVEREELVVPPREFSSLTTQPEPQHLAA